MVVFIWDGFPQYAARCVGAYAKATTERVVVIATRPHVPIEGMEKVCGCEVFWIDYGDKRSLGEMLGEVPRKAVVSGWFSPTINRWRDEVRKDGGMVVAMCDNNWHGFSWRELAKAIRFRLLFRNKYDMFFVPGKSGVRLLRFYGVPSGKIVTGLYAADSELFHNGRPLPAREKKIICVARFIGWKNAKRLMQAFSRSLSVRAFERSRCPSSSLQDFSGWTLDLYGSGPLKDELTKLAEILNEQLVGCQSKIVIHDFLQPEQLSEKYRAARIFCLPSVNEHWGLVVHEAALSGCVLLLSENVGAAVDFLVDGQNGWAFNPHNVDAISQAMQRAMSQDDNQLSEAQALSLKMSQNASLERFCKGVR